MKENYAKKLTREDLESWGFKEVNYIEETKTWEFKRLWPKNSSKKPILKVIKVTNAFCPHKYGEDKSYQKITFSIHGKSKSITIMRFLQAWFRGSVEKGYVMDHRLNDPNLNLLSNLEPKTVGENLKKRYRDNPWAPRNQYETQLYKFIKECEEKGLNYEEALKAYYERS